MIRPILRAGGVPAAQQEQTLDTLRYFRAAVGRPKELEFRVDRRGSRVIFISDRYAF